MRGRPGQRMVSLANEEAATSTHGSMGPWPASSKPGLWGLRDGEDEVQATNQADA
jgi:hypothetical protein